MRLQGSGVRTTSKTEAAAMTGGRLPSCGLEGRLNAGSPLGPVFNTVLGPCASRRLVGGSICPVDRRNRKVRQLVVGCFFLVEDLAEQLVRLIMPKILCPFP